MGKNNYLEHFLMGVLVVLVTKSYAQGEFGTRTPNASLGFNAIENTKSFNTNYSFVLLL